jgi:hypothetical protein
VQEEEEEEEEEEVYRLQRNVHFISLPEVEIMFSQQYVYISRHGAQLLVKASQKNSTVHPESPKSMNVCVWGIRLFPFCYFLADSISTTWRVKAACARSRPVPAVLGVHVQRPHPGQEPDRRRRRRRHRNVGYVHARFAAGGVGDSHVVHSVPLLELVG